jgi:hypothetical protein
MMDEQMILGGSHFCRPWTRDGNCPVKWRHRCTIDSVRYFYIDFGEAATYADQDNAVAFGRKGQIKEVPEYSDDLTVGYNPFKKDVFCLGSTFLKVIQVTSLLHSLRALHSELFN